MFLGNGLALSRPQPPSGGAAVFDPATLPLTGWWRASYGGAPWVATASAGTSGANGSLVAGTAPAVGAAQNLLTPADFNGSTHDLVNANLMSTFVTDAAGAGWVLFLADTATATQPPGSLVDNPGMVFQDGAGVALGIAFSSGGVDGLLYDGTGYQEITIACAVGAYHLARWRWNGVLFELGLDSAAMSTTAAANMNAAAAGSLAIGRNYAAAFFDGRILEVGLANTALLDADFTNIKSYINNRYGLAL